MISLLIGTAVSPSLNSPLFVVSTLHRFSPGISVGHSLNTLNMPLGSAIAGEADTSAVMGTISAIAAMTRVRVRVPIEDLPRALLIILHFRLVASTTTLQRAHP